MRPLRLEFGDGHREHVGRGAHDRADGQLAVAAAPLVVEIVGEAREVRERAARVREGGGAERRRMHAARVAIEQQKAERFLDIGEHAARARLRDVDGIGGLMKVAGIVERDEQRQMLELQPIDKRNLRGVLMVHLTQRGKLSRYAFAIDQS
jgi:hypothetical protein